MAIKKFTLAALFAVTSYSYSVQADTLLQVYQTAKIKDPIILKSKAQYDAYLEKVTQANAALLPQIGFGLETNYTNYNNDNLSNSNVGANIGLSQSLYNGSHWQQLSIAEKQATQYASIYGLAAQDLLFRASTAYFNVLRADEAVKSIKANKRAVERQLEQTKQRFEVGLIAITDVHEAQAAYDRTTADEIIAENNLANTYYALRELTGEDVLKVSYLNTNTFSAQKIEGGVSLWRSKALEYNLALHSKRIVKELAKMQIDLAKTGHKPTLDLTAGVGYKNTSYDNSSVSDTDISNGTIGLSLNVPIYTGGSINSQVKQAQYNYVYASEDLVQTFRSTEAQINRGYNNVGASISSLRAYEQTVLSSRSALDATKAGFEVGTRTIVDVLDATRALYESENLLANARYDYIINMLQLKLSAGTLAEQDIIDISNNLIEVDPTVLEKY
ncbi:type I secretion outer membrane protein, TolC family protein [Psychromonas ingrahamii 37]|uniref:Type I secretion outer membrane protein, TolC family protein n=1 Tax=Psychromonas ingrahamii (strain DSM 17664 / CCUG 51855 / 37) TaxID=357804 RepID=A1SZY1_PSYIN|nr:outer membrane channel protein TolC [Psychromonas ingrahamii]ABM05046.1 type I secretion outer membrane protein, TolC family protein [Psychromonas ingrahamii 37]